jgi:hypothetical protein
MITDRRVHVSLRFPLGQRVRLSEAGAQQFPRLAQRTGVVCGYGRADQAIRVKVTGVSTVETWDADWWIWEA